MNMTLEFSEQFEWALKQIKDAEFAEGVRAAFRAMQKLQEDLAPMQSGASPNT